MARSLHFTMRMRIARTFSVKICRQHSSKPRSDIVLENLAFKKYYYGNGVIPESEQIQFLNALQRPLSLSFRVTGFKDEKNVILETLKDKYVEQVDSLEPVKWYPNELAWRTSLTADVRQLPHLDGFHQWLISESESGHITRQELVSMIPVLLLDIRSHHAVLDMCASPGSKTSQIIDALHADTPNDECPTGFCIANDVNKQRCTILTHQVKRLSSPCCLVVNHDASNMPKIKIKLDDNFAWLQYDRILADVPCSCDGTLRKNREIWEKWKCSGTLSLHLKQLNIAKRSVELLKVGGRMVYSTCSMSPIEDEAVVAALIAKCKGAIRLVNIDGQLPGLKYSTGLSTWPVFHKDEFYTSYADCKQAQGSEFWLSLTGAALDFRNGLLLLILGSMFV